MKMSLRRIGSTVPLALLVAILAHVAGFGAAHAPGAGHSYELLTTLLAALGLLALATLLGAALRLHRRDTEPSRQALWLPLIVGLGSVAAFGLIELAEGHAAFGGNLRALAAIAPAAVLVARVSRAVHRLLRCSGAALAALVSVRSIFLSRFEPTRLPRIVAPRRADVRGFDRGRAPPLLA